MSQNEAKKQFRSVIRSDLNRWWEESNLDAEELAKVALKAIEDWLDEEIVGFEGEKGRGDAVILTASDYLKLKQFRKRFTAPIAQKCD